MDEALLLAINGLRTPWLDVVAAPLSRWGLYAFPLLMLLSLIGGDRIKSGRSIRDGWLVWSVATTFTEVVIKPLIGRPRPTAGEALREALDVLGRVPSAHSLAFPSGTATAAFAGATWIALRWGWKPGAPALILAALVSLSRVYGGVHWPTDIAAGGLFGAACAYGMHRLGRRLDRGADEG